jgi:hypothetical protein
MLGTWLKYQTPVPKKHLKKGIAQCMSVMEVKKERERDANFNFQVASHQKSFWKLFSVYIIF